MTPFARAILSSPASRPASYVAPTGGAGVPCRVLLNDTPGEIRRESGEEYYADDAELAASDSIPVSVKGSFVVGQSVYRVVSVAPSRAPGLIDCAVYRVSGPGVELFDLSGPILAAGTAEVVHINGRPVRAVVARRASSLVEDEDGTEIIAQRNRVGIKLADAQGVSAGSVVRFDNEDFIVSEPPRRTAAGLITLIC